MKLSGRSSKRCTKASPCWGRVGLLTQMTKELIQVSLQGEMDALESGANRRNGLTSKTMKTGPGAFELEVPRDRNGSFEPQLMKKRQTILNEELDQKILALYGLGTNYSWILEHLLDIYGVEVSPTTIFAVTDRLVPQMAEWRARPLESAYAVVFLDAIFFKTKQDNKVSTKVVYNIMGIKPSGYKEILGFYACMSEGAHFWLGVLNDLKAQRGEGYFDCLY